ncbi:uncharacterized protein LOC105433685 [Pogonomyrmex barbatus]|uniref:Uncharacterized protein LOC105433685 n=1 Tax=Pogonomyrmex barbatus TaxID=144034 RepID=A0A6I9XMW7_9HYME|nr:uncharacterized protein LOC105433685 [Pogonomyrmex barbatus]
MSSDILSIEGAPIFDDRIVRIETHTYNPYVNITFGYSDEIPIQQQDLDKRATRTHSDTRNDNNCVVAHSDQRSKITLLRIQWRMSHVILNDNKLSLLRTLDSERYLSIGFRSWDLYEFPLLQSTTKHSWAVKATTQLEKPRYMIFALQTGRKNVPSEDVSKFDVCKLTNVKLYLNSEFYPYDDMNLHFKRNKFAVLYDMYLKFRKAYYGCETCELFMTVTRFLQYGPLVVTDCSRQNESIKSATVDVRVEFECKENVPANTTAYCLIIHDRVIII